MTETKVEGATLTLTHHAAAPIGRVFQAFTDAAELHKWGWNPTKDLQSSNNSSN
jgi:uncharacterized protein YndB with AHSA1/START domain